MCLLVGCKSSQHSPRAMVQNVLSASPKAVNLISGSEKLQRREEKFSDMNRIIRQIWASPDCGTFHKMTVIESL